MARNGICKKNGNIRIFANRKPNQTGNMHIYDIIRSICPMPAESADRLVSYITEASYPKGSHLLEAGKTEKNIFFVKTGIVRAYLLSDGRDVTFWIGAEGSAVVSLKSYVADQPGYENVECVEDCTLYVLRKDRLETLFSQDIHIANWGRKFAELEFLRTEERFLPQLFTNATERYLNLLNNHPQLLQRIPLEHLASYLGITPVSLSRIRAAIGKKPTG